MSGIVYERVAEQADAGHTSVRAIRAQIGGSPNTILRHLRVWRASQASTAPLRALPAAVQRAWHEELLRVAAETREETGARLAELSADSEDVQRRADELERERDEALARIDVLTRERDTLAGKSEAQARELDEARVELERARAAGEESRGAATRERLAAEGLRAELDVLRAEVAAARAELQREHALRIEAEREQAALRASSVALTERLHDVQGRERAGRDEIEALRTRVETTLGAERVAAAELARLARDLTEAREGARAESARLRSELESLRDESAQLRGELERSRAEGVQMRGELATSALKLEKALGEVTVAQRELGALVTAREELAAGLATAREELASWRDKAHAAAIEHARLQGQLKALQPGRSVEAC